MYVRKYVLTFFLRQEKEGSHRKLVLGYKNKSNIGQKHCWFRTVCFIVLKYAEKVTFAIYVMTHGLRVSFFIVELTLVITCVSLLEVQCWSCIPLGQSICGQQECWLKWTQFYAKGACHQQGSTSTNRLGHEPWLKISWQRVKSSDTWSCVTAFTKKLVTTFQLLRTRIGHISLKQAKKDTFNASK